MGWNSQIEISEETVDLESGDRLVLYTDGVTECKNRSGEMFTEERLKSLIAKNVALTAQGLSIQIIRNPVELITPGPFRTTDAYYHRYQQTRRSEDICPAYLFFPPRS